MGGGWAGGRPAPGRVRPSKSPPPPGPRHDCADVVARERRTERDRVKIDRTITALMGLGRRNVIGPGTLALDAIVIDPVRLTHHDFGDAVCPIRAPPLRLPLAQRRIRLDDARARFTLEH